MKRIVMLILTIIICTLVIYICACTRCELRRNEIMNEMSGRLETLVKHTNKITAAEYTPFIWDTEYSYLDNTSLNDFEILIEGKLAEYLSIGEKEYRQLYFYQEDLVFDTREIRGNIWYYTLGWYFFYTGKLLPYYQLNIYKFENISIWVFTDEEQREAFEEHYGVGGVGQ